MKKLIIGIAVLVIVAGGIWLFNYISLTKPVLAKISTDARNEGISFDVHYKNYVYVNTLVFDLKDISSDKAAVDIFRIFLQTASTLKDEDFEIINLSYKGKTKFTLKGDYYKTLGKEYGEQNAAYTMRTFPENLYSVDGSLAYTKWEGGLLGVLTKQMEDFSDFHQKWYLNDLKGN